MNALQSDLKYRMGTKTTLSKETTIAEIAMSFMKALDCQKAMIDLGTPRIS